MFRKIEVYSNHKTYCTFCHNEIEKNELIAIKYEKDKIKYIKCYDCLKLEITNVL